MGDGGESWAPSVAFVFLLGVIFFASAVFALVWSRRNRQFDDFEKGSRSIFDEDEPEDVVTDTFPPEKGKSSADDEIRKTR